MKRWNFFLIVISCIVFASCSTSEQSGIQVSCKMKSSFEQKRYYEKIFILYPKEDKASDVTNEYHEGTLTVQNNIYQLIFPRTEKTWEMLVKLNRYTGKISVEWGTPPFDNFNPKNILEYGDCKTGQVNPI